MGRNGVDLTSSERRLEVEYPLETPQGVTALLSNIHYVRASAIDKGDFDAINLLVDFQIAFSKVELTERQKVAIHLVYVKDLTQREAGEIMGITQQAVGQLLQTVAKKVSDQYAKDLKQVEQGGEENDNHESTS